MQKHTGFYWMMPGRNGDPQQLAVWIGSMNVTSARLVLGPKRDTA